MFGQNQVFNDLKKRFAQKLKIAEDELAEEVETLDNRLADQINGLQNDHERDKELATTKVVEKHFGNLI